MSPRSSESQHRPSASASARTVTDRSAGIGSVSAACRSDHASRPDASVVAAASKCPRSYRQLTGQVLPRHSPSPASPVLALPRPMWCATGPYPARHRPLLPTSGRLPGSGSRIQSTAGRRPPPGPGIAASKRPLAWRPAGASEAGLESPRRTNAPVVRRRAGRQMIRDLPQRPDRGPDEITQTSDS